jgi:alanine racemase
MNRAHAEVNLSAIADNLKYIKSKTEAQVLAVVKADAYGHGLIQVGKAAADAGADWLGTALLEEGISLRNSGIRIPIISWLTPLGEDFRTAIELDIDLSISSVELLREVIEAGNSVNKIPRVHIEIDTGMSRGGVGDDWQKFLDSLVKASKSNEINLVGIWSHFARADEPDEKMNNEQMAIFEDRIKSLEIAGVSPQFIHIANSAASLTNKSAHKNIIRWGIGLYGLSPDVNNLGDSKSLKLKPAMKLKAKLHLVKLEGGA